MENKNVAEDDLKKKLAEAQKLFAKKSDQIKKAIYDLANAKYAPAQPLILQMLDSDDSSWRRAALSGLARWDEWSPEVIERMRKVVVDDDDEDVRGAAAGILGANNNSWPDPSLQRALEKDPSRRVRESALESALLLNGLTWPEVQGALADVRAGNVEPSLATFAAIIERRRKGKNKQKQ
jgi:hypothetical protein